MAKKVFVSGCFDLLHSGHVAFFEEAAQYGDLHVAIGSDQTIFELKGRCPINSEEERLFMIRSVSFVKQAVISRGTGMIDLLAYQSDPTGYLLSMKMGMSRKSRSCARILASNTWSCTGNVMGWRRRQLPCGRSAISHSVWISPAAGSTSRLSRSTAWARDNVFY
jgi:cytidyltransferase-like protein